MNDWICAARFFSEIPSWLPHDVASSLVPDFKLPASGMSLFKPCISSVDNISNLRVSICFFFYQVTTKKLFFKIVTQEQTKQTDLIDATDSQCFLHNNAILISNIHGAKAQKFYIYLNDSKRESEEFHTLFHNHQENARGEIPSTELSSDDKSVIDNFGRSCNQMRKPNIYSTLVNTAKQQPDFVLFNNAQFFLKCLEKSLTKYVNPIDTSTLKEFAAELTYSANLVLTMAYRCQLASSEGILREETQFLMIKTMNLFKSFFHLHRSQMEELRKYDVIFDTVFATYRDFPRPERDNYMQLSDKIYNRYSVLIESHKKDKLTVVTFFETKDATKQQTSSSSTEYRFDMSNTPLYSIVYKNDIVGQPHYIERGGFGIVFKAKTLSFSECAIKKFSAPSGAEAEHFAKTATKDIKGMLKLRHQNIVNLYGFYFDGDREEDDKTVGELIMAGKRVPNGYVMEFIPYSLYKICYDKSQKYTMHDVLKWFHSAANGLCYIHQVGFIHKDIKPSNILLTKDHVAKLCDFGCWVDKNSTTLSGGTLAYMSPEQLDPESARYTGKGDVYAMAISIWEMIHRKQPVPGKVQPIDTGLCDEGIIESIEKSRKREEVDRWNSPELRGKLEQLVNLKHYENIELQVS